MSNQTSTTLRSRRNWFIHQTYVRHEYSTCLKVIEEELQANNGIAEYAIYVKAMIMRHQGRISQSLQVS